MATIQGVYVALFGRPADPTGLEYFNEATGSGADLTQIGDLASTQEYKDRFAGKSTTDIINAIYQSLYNRDAEPEGRDFFAEALADGTYTINNIAIAILDGARDDDLTLVNKKIAAANLFTSAIDEPSEIAAYQGNAAAAEGIAYIDAVTVSSPVVDAAAAQAAVSALPPAGSTPGVNIALTDAVGETVVGTSGDDTITGVIDPVAANSTFNIGDQVDGGDGKDTLNLLVTGTTTLPAGSSIKDVEIVNVNYATDGTDIGPLNYSSFEGVKEIWQIDEDQTTRDYQDVTVGEGVTAGFRSSGNAATDVNVATTVYVEAGVTLATVALDEVADNSIVFLDGLDEKLETIEITGSVTSDAGNTLSIDDVDMIATTLNLGLTSDTDVVLSNFDALKEVDLSASTGDVEIDLFSNNQLESFMGSGAAETVYIDTSGTADTVVTMGGGDDVINLSAGVVSPNSTTITLGEGSDTVVAGNVRNVDSQISFADSLIEITDFNTSDDVLNVSGGGAHHVLSNAELSSITAAGSLEAALDLAASFTANTEQSVFTYGGDAYVLHSFNATLVDLDGLIKLTGVSDVNSLDASAFVI